VRRSRERPWRRITAEISGATVWRWLSTDAIRPWFHRSWIFPRDPEFAFKAGRVLDLYERIWGGEPLGDGEFVLSADEKTSIQARCRCHLTLAPAASRLMRVEHEYDRGALAYLAAWDVIVASVRSIGLPRSGPRSSSCTCLCTRPGSTRSKSTFPIIQRKVLTPNDFTELEEIEKRLAPFERRYEQAAPPFACDTPALTSTPLSTASLTSSLSSWPSDQAQVNVLANATT